MTRPCLIGVCLVVGVAACTSVRTVPPAHLEAKQLPHVMSVTYPDKSIVVVMDPELSADTLRGLRWGTGDTVPIPSSSVEAAQAKVPDSKKTLLLAMVIGLGVASSMFIVLEKTGKQDNTYDAHCFGDEAMKHPDEYPECGT